MTAFEEFLRGNPVAVLSLVLGLGYPRACPKVVIPKTSSGSGIVLGSGRGEKGYGESLIPWRSGPGVSKAGSPRRW